LSARFVNLIGWLGVDSATNPEENLSSQMRAQPELICGSIAAAAVAATVWSSTSSPVVLGWLLLTQLVYGTRLWQLRKLARKSESEPSESLAAVVGVTLSGFLWGAAATGCLMTQGVTWLTGIALTTTTILTILVLGSYLGRRRIVVPYVVATSAPIGIAGLVALDRATVVVGVSSMLFMAVISVSAKYIERFVKHSGEIAKDREKYLALLQSSEQEVKKLEIGLKTTNEKCLVLEEEISSLSSNLTISEGKADALANALDRVTPYDTQTGLLNAKKYVNVLEREWARMLRQELPISVVHMCIDNFDEYKENYGNIAYESAIRRIAELTRRIGTRPGDVVARLEENKFALLFPEADNKNGEILAGVLREKIRRLNMPNHSSPMHSAVTASFGVATAIPNSDLTIEEFAKRADSGLYEAQFQGGDKVVRYRVMNNVKLERWNRDQEGELTPDGLIRKLSVWGYDTTPRTYKPGEYSADKRIQLDTVDAIVQGQLKVSLEGESRVLKPGDCLFIPKGLVTSAEVVGDKPVICLEGTRV
jgi:diguanylate cyclase (GGDEF)-like protein